METSSPELRVMIDSSVLIAGIVWPRWSHEMLNLGVQGKYQMVLASYVIDQARNKIQTKFPSFLSLFEEFLQESKIEIVGNPSIEQVQQNAGLVRDITEVPVALAAIHAQVDYLVSEDKDLSAKDESTLELRKYLTVLIAGTFLREVMGWEGDELERVRKRTWKDLKEGEND